jgi:hypothetical protein
MVIWEVMVGHGAPRQMSGKAVHSFDVEWKEGNVHGRTAMGGHGIFKVSVGPAMPYPSTPCWRATTETALWLFQG